MYAICPEITSIVYSGWLVQNYFVVVKKHPLFWKLYLLNPMTPIVMGFQRALYGVHVLVEAGKPAHTVLPDVSLTWVAGLLVAVLAASLILLRLTWGTFFRMSGDFGDVIVRCASWTVEIEKKE